MKVYIKKIIIKLLTWEARVVLARHKPMVVAITGSLGKTGTKDAVAAALSAKYSVRKSQKSFNSEFGIPLTILGLPNAWSSPLKWLVNLVEGFWISLFGREYEEVLVLEIGADKPGDISSVAKWLKAQIVIITAVPEVPVHREFYKDSGAVLAEKASLVQALVEGGLLLTGDDERVSGIINKIGEARRVKYDNVDIIYNNGKPIGTEFTVGAQRVQRVGVLGEHQGYAIAFALAVAEHLDIDVEKVVGSLESAELTPGRMRVLNGINNSTIIDDSYNSSPTALRAALKALNSLKIEGKKVAILGDMKELGDASDREHRKAGAQIASVVDELYTIGTQARLIASEAVKRGLQEEVVHSYKEGEASTIGSRLAQTIVSGDVVLVKGSQGGIRLEQAVKELLQDKSKARELLVRQDKEWLMR